MFLKTVGKGFEPSIPSQGHQISSLVASANRQPLPHWYVKFTMTYHMVKLRVSGIEPLQPLRAGSLSPISFPVEYTRLEKLHKKHKGA